LKVLYLYDNQIEKIENLDFATDLEYLQLQNNSINEIPLLSMPCLMKLFLDDNKIGYCSGLEKCVKLEELHIANQNIPQHMSLQFDTQSLAAISRSLLTLEISSTGIEILSPFTVLKNLRKFFCSNNKVDNVDEVKDMVSLRFLSEADFKGNPCCSSMRYRDHAISASSNSLILLDEIPILRHQKVAIKVLFTLFRFNFSFNMFLFDNKTKTILHTEFPLHISSFHFGRD
jgi:protein phosphatase 1 regulatory subunit 42